MPDSIFPALKDDILAPNPVSPLVHQLETPQLRAYNIDLPESWNKLEKVCSSEGNPT
jgi:hypothetical protein